MNKFDIENLKRMLDSDAGYEWCLERPFADAERVGGLASNASADLTQVIHCLLVGYVKPAELLLEKAREWLAIAIENEEHPNYYGADGTEAMRYRDMSLINWLLKGIHDDESLSKYAEHQDRFIQGDIGRDKVEVSFILPNYVDAGRYDRALEIFENTPGLKKPIRPNQIRGEARMVYVMCRCKLGLEYTEEQMQVALNSFLNRNVNNWLVRGQAQRAAKWMKIAYWNDNRDRLTPGDAVLKCYDHLPHCQPPSPRK